MRRKHSEIDEIQLSDDTKHIKKGEKQCLKKIRRKRWKAYCRNFKRITVENNEQMMKDTNETDTAISRLAITRNEHDN